MDISKIVNELKECKDKTDIVIENYDGSYVLSQYLLDLYCSQYEADKIQKDNINWDDLNLIYYCATISKKEDIEKYVDGSSLNEENKRLFSEKLDKVYDKTLSEEPYKNQEKIGKPVIGMIARSMNFTLDKDKRTTEHYYNLVKLLIELKHKESNQIQNYLNKTSLFEEVSKIRNVGISTISAILHCNFPSIFPILNNVTKDIILNDLLEINKKKKKKNEEKIDFNKLVESYGKISKLMMEKFPCKNYRDLDVLINQYKMTNIVKEISKLIINNNKQIVLTGAPGTGKTYTAMNVAKYDELAKTLKADEESVEEIKFGFVQFHPSYDYTDFVEGLRPIQLTKDGNPTFVRMDGIFKDFCRRAANEKDTNLRYYFIIDEINRADLSKVFGELMYCLEYRGIKGRVKTQYNNLNTYIMTKNGPKTFDEINEDINNGKKDDYKEIIDIYGSSDIYKDEFYIPENVYIIGTMNDIDRSVESFDFALRRRFRWFAINVEDTYEDIINEKVSSVDARKFILERIKKLNNYIIDQENQMGLSKDYQLGAAYFKNYEETDGGTYITKIKNIYKNDIESILKEYVRGRDQSSIDGFLKGCRSAFGLKENYDWIDGKKSSKSDGIESSSPEMTVEKEENVDNE